MPHGWPPTPPKPKAHLLYLTPVAYFMAFDTMFRPLSFCATNIGHTKPGGLGYKQWMYETTCPHSRDRSSAYAKPRANPRPINCNVIPQKDTVMPYIAQPRYPLNSQVLAIFFPSATITTTPHHPALLIFSTAW